MVPSAILAIWFPAGTTLIHQARVGKGPLGFCIMRFTPGVPNGLFNAKMLYSATRSRYLIIPAYPDGYVKLRVTLCAPCPFPAYDVEAQCPREVAIDGAPQRFHGGGWVDQKDWPRLGSHGFDSFHLGPSSF